MSTPSPEGPAPYLEPVTPAPLSWVSEYAREVEGLQVIAREARSLAQAILDWFPVEGLPWVLEGSRDVDGAVFRVQDLTLRLDRLLYPLQLPFDATIYDYIRLINDGTPPETFLDEQYVAEMKTRPFRGDRNATQYGFASFTGSPSSAIQYVKNSQGLARLPAPLHTALAAVMACHDWLLRFYQWGDHVARPSKPWPCRWPDAPPVPESRVVALERAADCLGNLAATEKAKIDHYIAEKSLQTEKTSPPSKYTAPGGADQQSEEPPADGLEGGRWLRWKNMRYRVPRGVVYRLLDYMWARNSACYDDLIDHEVFDSVVAPQAVRSYANKVNTALPSDFPWRLSADSESRQLTKVSTAKGV